MRGGGVVCCCSSFLRKKGVGRAGGMGWEGWDVNKDVYLYI